MPSMEYTMQEIKDLGLPEKVRNQEVLNSLAEIAAHTGWSISKIRRLIKNYGLPAARYGLGQYHTTKTLLDKWTQETHLHLVIQHDWDKKDTHLSKVKQANIDDLRTYG